jgi:hypothetical protein
VGRSPRETRGRLWAWVYLAVFGQAADGTEADAREGDDDPVDTSDGAWEGSTPPGEADPGADPSSGPP